MFKVEFGAMKNGYFKREELSLIDQKKINALIKYYNNTDVYKGCYYRNNEKLMGDFYLDFDADITDDNYNNFKQYVIDVYKAIQSDFLLKDEHMKLYYSGAKGFHLIIPAHNIGFAVMENLNEAYKKIAMYYKLICPFVDTKIYDSRRVLRLPNSINSKTNLYKVEISFNELILNDFHSLKMLALNPREQTPISYVSKNDCAKNKSQEIISLITKQEKKLYSQQKKVFNKSFSEQDVIFPCIYKMIETVHDKGSRNEILIIIASHFFQKGISFEEAIEFFYKWNVDHFNPPLQNKEIYITVKSALAQFENNRKYGCKSILQLGYCDFNCSFSSRGENEKKCN